MSKASSNKMEDSSSRKKKIKLTNLPLEAIKSTDAKYWKKFETIQEKEESGITHISFSKVKPYNFAATSSHKVIIYDNSKPGKLIRIKTISSYAENIYGANLRSDGQLVVVGSESGLIKAHDIKSKAVLRTFKGHKKAVHACSFSNDNFKVMSGGDDATVRLWDLTDGRQISRFDGHREYVRALQQSKNSKDIWATGSYDHVCRIWDTRIKSNCVSELDHKDIITSLTFLLSENQIATAGDVFLNIWDIRREESPIKCLQAHRKNIMSIDTFNMFHGNENETRLISVSLDNYLKIHDMDGNTTYTVSYDKQALSVGVDKEGTTIAIGLSDGTIITRRTIRSKKRKEKVIENIEEHEEGALFTKVMKPSNEIAHLTDYEEAMKKFKYKEALDIAVKHNNLKIIISVIDELLIQNAMDIALKDRPIFNLLPILVVIRKNINKLEVSTYFTNILNMILKLYGIELMNDDANRREIHKICENLKRECNCLSQCMKLSAILDIVLSNEETLD